MASYDIGMAGFSYTQKQNSRLSLNGVYSRIEKTILDKKKIIFINDFDSTVSEEDTRNGYNPFHTKLHPQAGLALSGIEAGGGIICALSNRSGSAIAKRYRQAGIKHIFIISSYGFEAYETDPDFPLMGKTTIDPYLYPIKLPVTRILQFQRIRLLEILNLENLHIIHDEVSVPTPYGPLYIENKAICDEFPEGIARVINFNAVKTDFREKLLPLLREVFTNEIQQLRDAHTDMYRQLEQIWGEAEILPTELRPYQYSYSLEPITKKSKAFGIRKLMQILSRSGLNLKDVGMIIYAGDDEKSDSVAMRELKKLEIKHSGRLSTVGIWIHENRESSGTFADVQTPSVSAYTKILYSISTFMLKNRGISQ